jgi:two-component system nitrate/nitrite sensor histidine kinase NarX
VELQLLRILQEALANVRKHSGASKVHVSVQQENGFLLASVADDGTGFDPANRPREAFPRFGLAIMRERAESIGGSLDLETSPGRGTRVKIQVPISANSF